MRQLLCVDKEQGEKILSLLEIENPEFDPGLHFNLSGESFKTLDNPVVKVTRSDEVDEMLAGIPPLRKIITNRYGKGIHFNNDFSDVLTQNKMFLNIFVLRFDPCKDHAEIEKVSIDRTMKNFSASLYVMLNQISPDSTDCLCVNVLETELSQYEINLVVIEGVNSLGEDNLFPSTTANVEDIIKYLYNEQTTTPPFKLVVKGIN